MFLNTCKIHIKSEILPQYWFNHRLCVTNFWKLDILEELYYQKGFAVEDIKRDIDNIKREIEDITREIEENKIAIKQVNIYIL